MHLAQDQKSFATCLGQGSNTQSSQFVGTHPPVQESRKILRLRSADICDQARQLFPSPSMRLLQALLRESARTISPEIVFGSNLFSRLPFFAEALVCTTSMLSSHVSNRASFSIGTSVTLLMVPCSRPRRYRERSSRRLSKATAVHVCLHRGVSTLFQLEEMRQFRVCGRNNE